METVGTLKYLRNELNNNGDFLAEWGKLSLKDKAELKDYASAEMKVLGIYRTYRKD